MADVDVPITIYNVRYCPKIVDRLVEDAVKKPIMFLVNK
jgi:hypothetical protein